MYVVEINADKNEITVGSKDHLIKKEIKLKNLNLLADLQEFEKEIYVKVRSTGKLLKSNIQIKNNDDAILSLKEEEYGISPGQACVFYSKDLHGYKVLGGGMGR